MGRTTFMKTDLVLLHAPSVYDFRKKSIMFGPMSDLVPSTPIFEMYPIGFLTIANYLSKRNLKVRIINLAYLMYSDKRFDAEKFIKKLKPLTFGIDLHWLPHCQGSIEVAKIVKKYHPDTPLIFGGYSASYYWEELIKFDEVDFILRGDSTEKPLYELITVLKSKKSKDIKNISNLVWKTNQKVNHNPINNVTEDFNEIDFDYRLMFKEVLRYRDIKSIMPFSGWLRYPITTIPVIRGCNSNCSGCGGSKYTQSNFYNRFKPAYKNPKKLIGEIKTIQDHINSPIFLAGDLNANGEEYVKEFFKYAKDLNPEIQIFFEFFKPPPKLFFDRAQKVFKNICYEISPDSHDENIRKVIGKSFKNSELIDCIEYALARGAVRFDLYFMTGLPGQDKKSILEVVDFCKSIYEKLDWNKRFMPFISPMAPFIDPGSRAFENPEKFGYKILRKSLKDHIQAITMPSWKYILNYESKSISNDDLVDGTYKAALGLNRLKGTAGGISKKVMNENEERIHKAQEIMKEIDSIMKIKDLEARDGKLASLKEMTDKYSMSTVCEKRELEFPLSGRKFNWFNIIKSSLAKMN